MMVGKNTGFTDCGRYGKLRLETTYKDGKDTGWKDGGTKWAVGMETLIRWRKHGLQMWHENGQLVETVTQTVKK